MNPRRDAELANLALAVVLVLLCTWLCVSMVAHGQQTSAVAAATRGRFERADADDSQVATAGGSSAHRVRALHLARVCRLEADFRTRDCSAIVGVAKRRVATRRALHGTTWLQHLLRYSRLYDPVRRSARAKLTRRLPWGDVRGWPRQRNALWARLREHAIKLLSGEVDDPCGGRASHWGGRADEPWSGLVPVRCGNTANTFYAVAGAVR